MTADKPALVTAIIVVALPDCPLVVAKTIKVTVYSVPTVREYAVSLNTAGLCDTDRKESTVEKSESPGALAATVQP
jgi:hypothetical protein